MLKTLIYWKYKIYKKIFLSTFVTSRTKKVTIWKKDLLRNIILFVCDVINILFHITNLKFFYLNMRWRHEYLNYIEFISFIHLVNKSIYFHIYISESIYIFCILNMYIYIYILYKACPYNSIVYNLYNIIYVIYITNIDF